MKHLGNYALVSVVITAALFAIGYQNCSSSHNSSSADTATPNTAQSICPPNYVQVAGSSALGTRDFCVSKYEAKQVNSLPESQPEDTPWVDLDRDAAKTACAAKGSQYSLLDNAHWMTIAREIEATPWNYGGDVTNQEDGWSRGVTNNAGSTGVPASADDNDSCYLATQSTNGPASVCDLNTYDVARRVEKLSNGALIWDFAGNVSEWISDDFTTDYATKDWVLNIPAGTVKETFGPAGTYPPGPSAPTGNIFMQNFGYLSVNHALPYTVMRGGGFNYGRYAGIYTAYFVDPNYSASDIGFRCMYQP